jgi:WD40 repeat protein
MPFGQSHASSLPTTGLSDYQQTFRIGRGLPAFIAWHPTQDVILVDTAIGAWLYTNQLEDITYLPDARLARFSPNGRWLAGVDHNQNITLWDALTFEHIETLSGQTTNISQIVWNATSTLLASATDNGIISVWNMDTLEQVFFTHTVPMVSLKWNPNGTILAANTTENAIYLWDFSTPNPTQTAGIAPYEIAYTNTYSVRVFDWLSDTHIVRSSYTEFGYITDVQLFDLGEIQPLYVFDSSSFTWQISPDHNYIGFGDRVYDPHTLTQISNSNLVDVTSIEWSPDSQLLATTVWHYGNTAKHAKRLFIIQPQSGVILWEFAGHATTINHIVWSRDSQRIISADTSGRIRIWDLRNGTPLHLSEAHSQVSNVVEWSPDSSSIAVADQARAVNIWNLSLNEMTSSLGPHPQPVTKIAWRPTSEFRTNTNLLATHTGTLNIESVDNMVRIWDVENGNLSASIIHDGPLTYTDSIAWRPDGLILAISGGRSFDFWSMATRRSWNISSCNFNFPNTDFCPDLGEIGWSPDGRFYTVGWRDVGYGISALQFPNTTELLGGYSVSHGHSDHRGSGHWRSDSTQWLGLRWQIRSRGGFPPDYTLVLNTAYAVDDTEIGPIILAGHNGFVDAVYWSPDASYLMSVGQDDTSRLWNLSNGEQVFMTDKFTKVTWSPDGQYIAGISDQYIRILNAQTGALVDEWALYNSAGGGASLKWSPDSQSIAFSTNGVLTVWSQNE